MSVPLSLFIIETIHANLSFTATRSAVALYSANFLHSLLNKYFLLRKLLHYEIGTVPDSPSSGRRASLDLFFFV